MNQPNAAAQEEHECLAAIAQRVTDLQQRHQPCSSDEVHQQACFSAQAFAGKLSVLDSVLRDQEHPRHTEVRMKQPARRNAQLTAQVATLLAKAKGMEAQLLAQQHQQCVQAISLSYAVPVVHNHMPARFQA